MGASQNLLWDFLTWKSEYPNLWLSNFKVFHWGFGILSKVIFKDEEHNQWNNCLIDFIKQLDQK